MATSLIMGTSTLLDWANGGGCGHADLFLNRRRMGFVPRRHVRSSERTVRYNTRRYKTRARGALRLPSRRKRPASLLLSGFLRLFASALGHSFRDVLLIFCVFLPEIWLGLMLNL